MKLERPTSTPVNETPLERFHREQQEYLTHTKNIARIIAAVVQSPANYINREGAAKSFVRDYLEIVQAQHVD